MCKINTFNSNFSVDYRFLISFIKSLHSNFDFLFNLKNFAILFMHCLQFTLVVF